MQGTPEEMALDALKAALAVTTAAGGQAMHSPFDGTHLLMALIWSTVSQAMASWSGVDDSRVTCAAGCMWPKFTTQYLALPPKSPDPSHSSNTV